MAKLNAAERNKLPEKDFALPGRRYPVEDASHAKNALARASQFGSSKEKSKVRKKVESKFPGLAVAKKGSSAKKTGFKKVSAKV